MKRWQSLWQGPHLSDHVEDSTGGITCSSTWISTGLYALDMEDRAWTYCERICGPSRHRWFRVEDLTSGAAARQVLAEEGGDR